MRRSLNQGKEVRAKRKVQGAIVAAVLLVGTYFSVRAIFGASNDVLDVALLGDEKQEIVLPLETTTTESSIYRGNTASPSKKTVAKKENLADVNESVASPGVKQPTWCGWGEEAATTSSDILLSETNKTWIGIKNISDHDIDTNGWQIISSDEKIKIKLSGKRLEAGRSYHVTRPDAGDEANLEAWFRLFKKDCELIAEVKAPTKVDIVIVPIATTTNPTTSPNIFPPIATLPLPVVSPSIPNPEIPQPIQGSTATSTPIASSSVSTLSIAHLVIALIETSGGEGENDHDLIKIYNPTDVQIDISGWKLRKRTSSGSEASIRVLPKESKIDSKAYFVWANGSYSVTANTTSTQTLADDNSVALLTLEDKIVDAVGWGKGKEQYKEGAIFPTNPAAGKALVRKFEGEGIKDSDDNAEDFEVK